MSIGAPPPPERFLAAPPDPYTERITTGVAYLGGFLMLPLLFAYLSNTRWDGLLIPVAFALVLAVFLTLAYAARPVAYRIEATTFVVERQWLPALRVPLKRITAVSVASHLADIPRHGVRFAFNPGVFGYQGPFYLAPYGRAFLLATNREKLVQLARGADTPLVVSPASPRRFSDVLRARLASIALPPEPPASGNGGGGGNGGDGGNGSRDRDRDRDRQPRTNGKPPRPSQERKPTNGKLLCHQALVYRAGNRT